MRYRALDDNGDMTFGGNNKNFLKDIKAVIQAIKTRIKLLKGEWWENTETGPGNIVLQKGMETRIGQYAPIFLPGDSP